MQAIDKDDRRSLSLYSLLVPACLSVLLIIISRYNFLLFHTLAELFAVIVAVLMSVVAWQMYPFTRNNYLMYLGSGYFWVGSLDLVHALLYKGMNIYLLDGAAHATDFWIATRFLEAFLLLTAPWFLSHQIRVKTTFFIFGFISFSLYLLIVSGLFPETFIEGSGLTDFKIFSEYVIIILLALAIFYLYSQSYLIDKRMKVIVIVSIALTMCAELAFTFYVSVFGLSNLVGHIFKFFSFWLIYTAMIRMTLQEPFKAMSRGSSTYDAIPDATIMVSTNGVIQQVNHAASKLAGVPKAELMGESSHQWFHPSETDEEECEICKMTRIAQKIQGYEVEDIKNKRWLDFSLSPVDETFYQDAVFEVIRDITHRKQVEQSLDDVSESKDLIVENLPAMLFVKRAEDLRYVEWNKAAEELTGLKREEMLGKNDYDFFTEDEADSYIAMDKKVLEEGRLHDIPEETIHTRYNGVRLLHTRKIPIFDRSGKVSYLLGISQDITQKRETEEMLRRSQKMEVVGQLSGGIAHDFNNQLGIVIGYLEFLKAFVKNNEKQRGWIASASKAAHRCVELTRQLLLFARDKSAERTDVDINNTIAGIEALINKSVTPEVDVVYQLESGLWPVLLDLAELEDAIVSVITNSRDAITDGGEIIIRTSNVYLDDEVVIANHGVKAGEYVMLEIKDNGCGMEQDVLEHIYEPFFTTKQVGSGTGLGMSMIYAFIQRYDGTIKIDSVPGEGSSVKIYLPRSTEDEMFIGSVISDERNMVLPKGSEIVLIVDDEQELLNLTGEYISGLGYTIFKASNGHEALHILSKEKIDLVFSDIVMPGGISGFELAERVSKEYPEIKILLSSGYPRRSLSMGYQGVVLAKPYTRQDLANQLRRKLEE